jgi:hypothetical protein
MMAVVELTPRFVKNFRSFSSARFTRILRRVLARAQRRADFRKIFVLKKSQHDGVVVFLAEAFHRAVQQRGDLRPGFVIGLLRRGVGLQFKMDCI